jgi:hypothetical protein
MSDYRVWVVRVTELREKGGVLGNGSMEGEHEYDLGQGNEFWLLEGV